MAAPTLPVFDSGPIPLGYIRSFPSPLEYALLHRHAQTILQLNSLQTFNVLMQRCSSRPADYGHRLGASKACALIEAPGT